jgi:hypothetical protein
MKKLLFFIASFLFVYQSSNAQTAKGDQTLGVDLGFTYSKSSQYTINPYDNSSGTSTGKTTTFNIGPNYSYFIANNLDIGASLQYSSSTTNNTADVFNSLTKQFDRNYGGEIYLRKYFMYANKIGIRAGAYAGYFKQNTQYAYIQADSYDDYNAKTDNYLGGFNLALVYYPSKCLGVSLNLANLEYDHSKTDATTQGHSSSNNIYFNYVNDGLGASIFYVFGSKK